MDVERSLSAVASDLDHLHRQSQCQLEPDCHLPCFAMQIRTVVQNDRALGRHRERLELLLPPDLHSRPEQLAQPAQLAVAEQQEEQRGLVERVAGE